MVLVFPESYSKVIPSLAISAAFSWALVASRTLFEDWKSDQELVVSVIILFFVSCKISSNSLLLWDISRTESPILSNSRIDFDDF